MEKLLSSGFNHETLPSSYIQPLEKRPKNLIPAYKHTPIIDLRRGDDFDRANTIHEIIKASKEFGFFQCVDYNREEKHFWRDVLRHQCNPIEDFIPFWPSKPSQYREVVSAYAVKQRALCLELLELISEGLGLQKNYFDGELLKHQYFSITHYPQCPHPGLTLGLPPHIDPNLVTLLLQGDVFGLQVLHNHAWLDVEPVPNTFVVILGHILQIISNGKVKAAEHRVLTNSSSARTTIANQIFPSNDCVIKPAEEAIDLSINPAKFRPFKYREFIDTYFASGLNTEKTLQPFKLHPDH